MAHLPVGAGIFGALNPKGGSKRALGVWVGAFSFVAGKADVGALLPRNVTPILWF